MGTFVTNTRTSADTESYETPPHTYSFCDHRRLVGRRVQLRHEANGHESFSHANSGGSHRIDIGRRRKFTGQLRRHDDPDNPWLYTH